MHYCKHGLNRAMHTKQHKKCNIILKWNISFWEHTRHLQVAQSHKQSRFAMVPIWARVWASWAHFLPESSGHTASPSPVYWNFERPLSSSSSGIRFNRERQQRKKIKLFLAKTKTKKRSSWFFCLCLTSMSLCFDFKSQTAT